MKKFFDQKDIVMCEEFDDGSTLLVIVVKKHTHFYHLVDCIHSLLTLMQNLLYKGPNTCRTCNLRLLVVTDLGICPYPAKAFTVRRRFNAHTNVDGIKEDLIKQLLKGYDDDDVITHDFNYVCIYTEPSKGNPTHTYRV